MSQLRRRVWAAVVVLAVGSGAFIGGHAIAASSGQPADKVVAAGSGLVPVGSGGTIMSGVMHTSKPTDVMFHVTLECSILTSLTTNNTTPASSAESRIRVWIEVDQHVVAIDQISTPPQNPTPAGHDNDKVTFCDREYSRSVTNGETLPDGIDNTSDYIRTKSSHGFNWVKMNMGNGDHTIEVKAEFTTNTSGTATATATIGNRTLIAEPTKMANDAIISPTGT